MSCHKFVTIATVLILMEFALIAVVVVAVVINRFFGKIWAFYSKKDVFNLPIFLLQLLQSNKIKGKSKAGKGFRFVTTFKNSPILSQVVTKVVTSCHRGCHKTCHNFKSNTVLGLGWFFNYL